MKTYKDVKRLYTETVLDFVVCDLCGTASRSENWSKGAYDFETVTIRHEWGGRYPEVESGNAIAVHICPNCFKEKLIPWLKAQGAEPTEESWEVDF